MATSAAKTGLTWTLSVALCVGFLWSAYPKVAGDPVAVRRFAEWGYGPGFLLLVGILEAIGGLLLLFPRLASYGAAILLVVMLGATYTHLTSGIGSPLPAALALVLAAAVGWWRKTSAVGLS